MTHDPTNPFAPRPRSCVPDNRSHELLQQLRASDPGSWLIPANLGFSTEDVRPLYDRGIIELKVQMGMATCRIKPSFSNAAAEVLANRIVGAFILEPNDKARELAMKWIAEAIEDASKPLIEALEQASVMLGFSFQRIHGLPRSRDTELANDIEKVRAQISVALKLVGR